MRMLHIDFAPPSLSRSLQQTSMLTWLGIILGATFCISGAASIADLTQQQAALLSEQQHINDRINSRIPQQPASQKSSITELQAKALNSAIVQLNLPWRDLLDALETATPDTIALLSLEPDGKKNLLKGIAEAKTAEDMLHYIEALKRQPFFGTVNLTKHAVNEQDPNKPLRFQFDAQWRTEAL
jgi:Tfp pilus assembly protein PilN